MGPSAIPSSEYCTSSTSTPYWKKGGVGGGSLWKQGWLEFQLATTLEIDAVCQCSLGPQASMFEMSGVLLEYTNIDLAAISDFADPSTRSARAASLKTLFNWEATPSYGPPLHFYCREDYVLYWQLRIAANAIFGQGDATDVYTAKIQGWAALAPSNVDYWRLYYTAGVDCQRKLVMIPGTPLDLCPAGMTVEPANRFITNESYVVGLDIGHLFYQINTTAVFGTSEAATEPSDPDVLDYLWALASLRRRNPTNLATGQVMGNFGGDEDPTPELGTPSVCFAVGLF